MNELNKLLTITSMAVTTVSLAKNKDFLKNNWKPIVGIGAALSLVLIGYGVYKRVAPADPGTPGGLDSDKRFPPSDLTGAQSAILAGRLHEAMKTLGKANEQEIKEIRSVLQDLTYNDFIKVSQAFGDQGYVPFTHIGQDTWPATHYNLVTWLNNELPSAELQSMHQALPNIF